MIIKAIKYRHIVLDIIGLTCKYWLLKFFLSNKQFFDLVHMSGVAPPGNNLKFRQMQPKQKLIGLTEKIFRFLFPHAKCLLRSLVQRDILLKYGYNSAIVLGMYKKQNSIKAHACLQRKGGFKYITEIHQIGTS